MPRAGRIESRARKTRRVCGTRAIQLSPVRRLVRCRVLIPRRAHVNSIPESGHELATAIRFWILRVLLRTETVVSLQTPTTSMFVLGPKALHHGGRGGNSEA